MAVSHLHEVPVDPAWFASQWELFAVRPDTDQFGKQKKDKRTGDGVWRVICSSEDHDGTMSYVKVRVVASQEPVIEIGAPARLIGLVAHPIRLRSGDDILWLEATGVESDAAHPQHGLMGVDDDDAA